MTKQKAIEILEEVKEFDDSIYSYDSNYMEALEVAIESLKEKRRKRMIENRYKVFVGGHLTAENMPLEDAMIYVKGLFTEYYNDVLLEVKIIRDVEVGETE